VNDGEHIGVFGGTFDPIHNAHLAIARAALAEAGLDRVIFVVAARPPHKEGGAVADPEDRYAMVAAAVANEDGMEASRLELEREGLSYTTDTLAELERLYPQGHLHLILGLDSLVDFPKWKDPAGILARARVLAVSRPGSLRVAPELEGHYDLLPFEETDLSSTEVRRRITEGEPLDDVLPAAVQEIIRERHIYGVCAGDK